MSCQSTSFAKAASPVGPALTSGDPNTWNVGAGNHYSYLENPFLPDPMATRAVIRQTAGKKKRNRKHKKTAKKHPKKYRKRKTRRGKNIKKRRTRKKRGGIFSMLAKAMPGTTRKVKNAVNCNNPKLSFSQRMACKGMSSMGRRGLSAAKKMNPQQLKTAAKKTVSFARSPAGRKIGKTGFTIGKKMASSLF